MSNEGPPQSPPEEPRGQRQRPLKPIAVITKDGSIRHGVSGGVADDYGGGLDKPPGNLPITPQTDGSETNN